MSLEFFLRRLEVIDAESEVLERQILVRIDMPDSDTPIYKLMSSAGAIYCCMVYGPVFSIVEVA